MTGHEQHSVNQLLEELKTKETQSSPQPKRCGSLCAFKGDYSIVIFRHVGSRRIEQIRCFLLKCTISVFLVPIEHQRTNSRHEHHFVRIEHNTIRPLQPFDQMAVLFTKTYSTAVRSIDMQPDLMTPANICDGVKWIKRAHRSGTGHSDYRNDRHLLCSQFRQHLIQSRDIHPTMHIQRNTQHL